MTGIHQEKVFEAEMLQAMGTHGWQVGVLKLPTGTPDEDRWLYAYDRVRALYPIDVISWLRTTQPAEYAKVKKLHNGGTDRRILDRLVEELDKHGPLHVLRKGFKDVNARFQLVQFKPASTINPELEARHGQVVCRAINQLRYSTEKEDSIDVVLFVNGIPVVTEELKTDLTQSIGDAMRQYREDRPPKDPKSNKVEPLLAGNRALVHFAVSTDEVRMTTRLEGPKTAFLPFNRGYNFGKGNPPVPGDYRSSYLWNEVLTRDSLLDLLQHFLHKSRTEKFLPNGQKEVREALIFPRYHQLGAVRLLRNMASVEGAGHDYLIQHSAGSGKSNTIAWVTHQLSTLSVGTEKVFDTVIVLTDRTVLDDQLQETVAQFEQQSGQVVRITDSQVKTDQLAKALSSNAAIIILTIQTFPAFMAYLTRIKAMSEAQLTEHLQEKGGKLDADAVKRLEKIRSGRYAIVADEAHSSQTGQSAVKVREALGQDEPDGEDDLVSEASTFEKQVGRGNLSYFAFTATPKAKTLQRFGRRPDPSQPAGPGNTPVPLHVYSMQQAIEEEYILDVLKNYTSYKTAWRLAHQGQDYGQAEVDQKRAHSSVIRWVRLHDHNIAQRVAIIVEHFRDNVASLLNGQAKAMIVTDSRLAAVLYKQKVDEYIKLHGYPLGTLVAFSGEVTSGREGEKIGPFTESNLNHLDGVSIPEALDGEHHQVLIVANKYQTGFDQPKLCAMYVDKRLDGVQAVQTLSRLNRIFPGKTQTFVLDFVNEPDAVLAAFLPYYGAAQLTDVTDPNMLHALQAKLDAALIYTDAEITEISEAYAQPNATQKKLQGLIAPVVDRYRARWKASEPDSPEQAALEVFRADLGLFVRQYDFLTQIITYDDADLARRAVVFRLLLPLIVPERLSDTLDLSGLILTHHRIRSGAGVNGIPTDSTGTEISGGSDAGSGAAHVVKTTLDELVGQLNGLFEGQLTDGDLVNYAHSIRDKMMENPVLEQQAAANSKENFSHGDFKNEATRAMINTTSVYSNMTSQVLGRKEVMEGFTSILLDLVYEGFRKRRETGEG